MAGCAGYSSHPPGTVKSIELADVSPVVTSEQVTIAGEPLSASPPFDYLVGPGDILSVTIYGLPNFSSEGRPELPSAAKGSRVDSAGTIQVPLVGSVQVAGLSLQQIRDRLQDSFRKYLKNPSVVVEIVEYKSHPLYLLGQFKKPGTHYMDRPVNLLQGVSLGDGLDSTANLRGARLLRGKKIVPVDIYSLLHDGDQRQNVWLSPGDTVYVPDNTLQNVFVFGAVKTPGPIPMKNGQLSLHQAVAAAGGLGDTSYDRNIRIIRSITPTRGELIVVDLDKILAGEAKPFPLIDGDIVYVPKGLVGNWNQAINELLPTFQLLGAILNPFVQMKFLQQ
jgi:polysaccharide biosynthesis/export protein